MGEQGRVARVCAVLLRDKAAFAAGSGVTAATANRGRHRRAAEAGGAHDAALQGEGEGWAHATTHCTTELACRCVACPHDIQCHGLFILVIPYQPLFCPQAASLPRATVQAIEGAQARAREALAREGQGAGNKRPAQVRGVGMA